MTLCEHIEAMQPLLDKFLSVEQAAVGIAAQLDAIPANVRHGEGPEELLGWAQARLDARFWTLLGCEPMPGVFASPTRIRDVLNRIEQVAHECDAIITLDPWAPRAGWAVWTDDRSLYDEIPSGPVVGGQHPIHRLKFAAEPSLTLRDDGSLT